MRGCESISRGRESVSRGRESVSKGRESVDRGLERLLRMSRPLLTLSRPLKHSQGLSHGCESALEAQKVPVEVVRESVGKTVLKNSGTNQNVLVLFKIFRLNGKVLLLF